jgi:hypothetical protein
MYLNCHGMYCELPRTSSRWLAKGKQWLAAIIANFRELATDVVLHIVNFRELGADGFEEHAPADALVNVGRKKAQGAQPWALGAFIGWLLSRPRTRIR